MVETGFQAPSLCCAVSMTIHLGILPTNSPRTLSGGKSYALFLTWAWVGQLEGATENPDSLLSPLALVVHSGLLPLPGLPQLCISIG